MVSVIRELQRLEGAKDLQDTLIQEVADKMPEAMKRAGLSQEQINLVIRNWVEMVRDLE
jgi:ribosome-binding protein aMBF1 (putative translation factor)